MDFAFGLQEIDQVAGRFVAEMAERTVVAFNGDMGAGKTTFIQAVCRQLGVTETMSSPTFSIINEYAGSGRRIFHIDLYRCRFEEEVVRAGVEECLYSGEFCFVEWPSVARGIFPSGTLFINIEAVGPEMRRVWSGVGIGD